MPVADYVLIEVAEPEPHSRRLVDKSSSRSSPPRTSQGHRPRLSTVYGIVKQTGGFVYVESEPGRGTTFQIFLPRHHPEADAASETQAATPDAARPQAQAGDKPRGQDMTGQGTILLVEDEEGLRGLNARGLRSRGYNVIEAATASRR